MGQENPMQRPQTVNIPIACSVPMKDSKIKTKETRQPFPCKVYSMLEDADNLGFHDIVSWNKEGNGFMVHNKERFINEIVPKYYNQTRYKSFQRQLSLYGFQRATAGANKGLRYHPKMRRGFPEQCRDMKPVGYKPRGQEYREKQRQKRESLSSAPVESDDSYSSPTTIPDDQQAIPAVVSSNSIHKDLQTAQTVQISQVNYVTTTPMVSEITEKLISTDTIGFFEGMPFYLMTTTTSEACKSTSNAMHQAPQASRVEDSVDSQMKKAWEIGFAMAMTMNPSESASIGMVATQG